MKNLERNRLIAAGFFFIVLMAMRPFSVAFAKDVPIDRDFLSLPDGRWIWLEKTGQDTTLAMVGKGMKSKSNAIWSKTYESDESRAWEYAYFVRLKPGIFAADLDHDGNIEIGISTYDMGNNMIRKIMIFSVQGNRLVVVKEQGPFNIAADESVFGK